MTRLGVALAALVAASPAQAGVNEILYDHAMRCAVLLGRAGDDAGMEALQRMAIKHGDRLRLTVAAMTEDFARAWRSQPDHPAQLVECRKTADRLLAAR